MREATLVLLLKDDPVFEVLLGYKKTGFGQGKYTGFGGKIERGEGVVEAALRELIEETSITVNPVDLAFSAILEFRFPRKRSWSQRVYVFTSDKWQGTPIESNEMIPRWFLPEKIPYNQMWVDGAHWLPLVLSGKKFQAQFTFNAHNATLRGVHFLPLETESDG